MNIQYLFLLLFLLSCETMDNKQTQQQLALIDKIDWEQFRNDLEFVNESNEFPLGNGVFPVPEYESSGNGNIEEKIEICNMKFIQQNSFIYKGEYNEPFFKGITNPDIELCFFTILVKTSLQDSSNQIMSSSRNHPTYLSQGIVKIENERKISWVASHNSASKNDMALINMRYFDLSKGRIIIVVPREDGSLRFKQLNTQPCSILSLGRYIEINQKTICPIVIDLLKEEAV